MLSVPSCKWSRSLGGEYVDGASCIYAVFVWRIPGALGKSGDTFGYPVGDLSRDLYLTTVIVWVRHLLCQPDNCNGKRFVSGSSGPSGGATYRGIGGIKSFIGVFHNLVENSSIFPLGVGNG